jgi:hypothetical protein
VFETWAEECEHQTLQTLQLYEALATVGNDCHDLLLQIAYIDEQIAIGEN